MDTPDQVPTRVTVNGRAFCLRWNSLALYRLCSLPKSSGWGRNAQIAWAMLPRSERDLYPTVESFVEHLPYDGPESEAWQAAVSAAIPGDTAPNASGGASVPAPASAGG